MMPVPNFPRLFAVSATVLALCLNGALTQAQQPQAQQPAEYTPRVGQDGKDVMWVPTPQTLVDKMMDMAKVTDKDYVIDLGSGDGRTVITAAKRGARAHGIEYNPDMVELSKLNAEKEGVAGKATFEKADIFESDFSQATVITLFLLTDLNRKLRPTLLRMKPGTRVVSNTFGMGDWIPDDTVTGPVDCVDYCKAFFWLIPARAEGKWKLPQGELVLKQQYQMITGTLRSGKQVARIKGKMSGNRITFTAGKTLYEGHVGGDAMELATKSVKLRATRRKA